MKHTHTHLRNGFSLAESRLLSMVPTGPEANRGPEARVEAGAGGSPAEGPDSATLRANLLKDIQDLTKRLDEAGDGPAKRRAAETLQKTLDTVNRELAAIDEQLAAVVRQAEDAIARAGGGPEIRTPAADPEKKDTDMSVDELNTKYNAMGQLNTQLLNALTADQQSRIANVQARFVMNTAGIKVVQSTITPRVGTTVIVKEHSGSYGSNGEFVTNTVAGQFRNHVNILVTNGTLRKPESAPPPREVQRDAESITAIDAAKSTLDTAWGRLTEAERRDVRLADKYNDLTRRCAALKTEAGRALVRDRLPALVAEIVRFVRDLEEMTAPAEDRESITAIDAAKAKLDRAWGRLTEAERRDVRLADKYNDLTRRAAGLKTEAATASVRDKVPALTRDIDRFVKDLEETFGPEAGPETPLKKITDAKKKLDDAWTALTARATPGRRATDTHEELSRRFVALMAPAFLPIGEAVIDPAAADKYVADVDAFVRSITPAERLDDRKEALLLRIEAATTKLKTAWDTAPAAKKTLLMIAAYNGLLGAGGAAKGLVENGLPGAAAAVDAYAGQVDRFVAGLAAPVGPGEGPDKERLVRECRERMQTTVGKLEKFAYQSDRDNRVAERLRTAVTAKLEEAATKPLAEARVLIGQADALVMEAEAMVTREENWEKAKATAFNTMPAKTWTTLPGNAGKPGFVYYKGDDGSVYAYCPTIGRDFIQTMDRTTMQWTVVQTGPKLEEIKATLPSADDATRLVSGAEVQRMKELYPEAALRAKIIDIAKAAPYNKDIAITAVRYGVNGGRAEISIDVGGRAFGLTLPMTSAGKPLNYPPMEEVATFLACYSTTGTAYMSEGQMLNAATLRRNEGLMGDGFGGGLGIGPMRFDGRKPYFDLPGGKRWINVASGPSWALSTTDGVPNLPEAQKEIENALTNIETHLKGKAIAGANVVRTGSDVTMTLRNGDKVLVTAKANGKILVELQRKDDRSATAVGTEVNPTDIAAIRTNADTALRQLNASAPNPEDDNDALRRRFDRLISFIVGGRGRVVVKNDLPAGTTTGIDFERAGYADEGTVLYQISPRISEADIQSFVAEIRAKNETWEKIPTEFVKFWKNTDNTEITGWPASARANPAKTLEAMQRINNVVLRRLEIRERKIRPNELRLVDGSATAKTGNVISIGVDATEDAITAALRGAPAPSPETNEQKKTRFEGLLRAAGATDYEVDVRNAGLPAGRKSGVGYLRNGKVEYVIAPDMNDTDMTAFVEEIRSKGTIFVNIAKTIRAIESKVSFGDVQWHSTTRENPAKTLTLMGFVKNLIITLNRTQCDALTGKTLVIADGDKGTRTANTITIGIDAPIGEVERALKGTVAPEAPEIREALNTLDAHILGKGIAGLRTARVGTTGLRVTAADGRELTISFNGKDRMEFAFTGSGGSSPVDCTNVAAVRAFADRTLRTFLDAAPGGAPEDRETLTRPITLEQLRGAPRGAITTGIATKTAAIPFVVFEPSTTGGFTLKVIVSKGERSFQINRTLPVADLEKPGAIAKLQNEVADDCAAKIAEAGRQSTELAPVLTAAKAKVQARYPAPFTVDVTVPEPGIVRVYVRNTSAGFNNSAFTDVEWANGPKKTISSVNFAVVAGNSIRRTPTTLTTLRGADLTADTIATAVNEAQAPNPRARDIARNLQKYFSISEQDGLDMLKFSVMFRDFASSNSTENLPVPDDAGWQRAANIAKTIGYVITGKNGYGDFAKIMQLWQISAGIYSEQIVNVLKENPALLTTGPEPARTGVDSLLDRSTILILNDICVAAGRFDAETVKTECRKLQERRTASFRTQPNGEGLDAEGKMKTTDVLIIIDKSLAGNLSWSEPFVDLLNQQRKDKTQTPNKKILWVDDYNAADFYRQSQDFSRAAAEAGRHLAVVSMVHGPSNSAGMIMPFKDAGAGNMLTVDAFKTRMGIDNASWFLESCYIGRHLRRDVRDRGALARTYAGADTTVNAMDNSLTYESAQEAFRRVSKKVMKAGKEETVETFAGDIDGDGIVTYNELRFFMDRNALFHDGIGYDEGGDRLADAGAPRPDRFGGRGEPTVSA